MSACCDCCVLSGRGLYVGLITRPEESYWLWCVVVCDLETSRMRRSWPTGGATKKNVLDTSMLVIWAPMVWTIINHTNTQTMKALFLWIPTYHSPIPHPILHDQQPPHTQQPVVRHRHVY
jgi:hypothetical protein